MSPITIGLIVLIVGFCISLSKLFYTGFKFNTYIKSKYPGKWDEMAHENIFGKALAFFSKGTVAHFMYKSKDDFGDQAITIFREQIRKHVFTLFIIYPISFICFVLVVIWFLETR